MAIGELKAGSHAEITGTKGRRRYVSNRRSPYPPRPLGPTRWRLEATRLKIDRPRGGPHDQTPDLVTKLGTRVVEKPKLACRFVKLIGADAWTD